jgi:hypothetical protein
MLDKATVLTTLFTIVDDAFKVSILIREILKRPGPTPSLSDSEVVTIALYQELIGEPRAHGMRNEVRTSKRCEYRETKEGKPL